MTIIYLLGLLLRLVIILGDYSSYCVNIFSMNRATETETDG